jgi:hypothetical protein
MKALHSIAAAVVISSVGIAPAMAQTNSLQNGSFAGNSLSSWTSFGDVSVSGPRNVAALTTASVAFDDDAPLSAGFNNRSGTAAVDFFDASDLAGVSFGSLDSAGGGFTTYEGSAIRQDFYANAGDILNVKFDWAFLSGDQANSDFGFLAINGTVVKFVDAFSPLNASQFGGSFGSFDNVTWDWKNADYTYTANANGNVSFVLGVVDVGDSSFTSELRVDNISVVAVPEPETYAMLIAGLAMMGAIARRRRRQG